MSTPFSLPLISARRASFSAKGIFFGCVMSDPGPSIEFFSDGKVKAWLSKCSIFMPVMSATEGGRPRSVVAARVKAASSAVVQGWLTQKAIFDIASMPPRMKAFVTAFDIPTSAARLLN